MGLVTPEPGEVFLESDGARVNPSGKSRPRSIEFEGTSTRELRENELVKQSYLGV